MVAHSEHRFPALSSKLCQIYFGYAAEGELYAVSAL